MKKAAGGTDLTEKSWQAPPNRTRPVFLVPTVLYWISLYLYIPILAPYVEYRGGSLSLVGLVVSAYGLAQLLLRLPLGILSDRLGRRKPFLALGFVASSVACLGFILAPTPGFMVGARFVSGIAACAWVAFTVLFTSYFPPAHTTRAISTISFCNTLSIVFATTIGGLLADTWGWLAPFWASAGVGLLGLLCLLPVYERPHRRPAAQPTLQSLRSVVRYPELVLASVVTALGQYTTFATSFGFVTNYAVTIGATKTQLGILTTIRTLTSALAILLSGRYLAPRLGPRFAVCSSYLTVAAVTAAIPYLQTVGLLYASQVLVGFGRGVFSPILMGLAIARLPDSEKATAMGFYQAVYAIGMFAGPAISGLIGARSGYPALFISAGAVAALAGLVALRLPGRG